MAESSGIVINGDTACALDLMDVIGNSSWRLVWNDIFGAMEDLEESKVYTCLI